MSPEEVRSMMQVERKTKLTDTPRPTRVTQVHGSLKGKDILTKVKAINKEKKKKKKEEEKKEKKKLKERKVTAFIRCEIRCVCLPEQKINGKCAANGLRKCSECGSVLKGDCGKQACKMVGRTSMFPACMNKSRDENESENESDTDDEEDDATPSNNSSDEEDHPSGERRSGGRN